jgi:hypothetical protein
MARISETEAPNQLEDLSTRLQQAKAFLTDNPTETRATAARIYKVKLSTLCSSLSRPQNKQHGGQNKVLEDYHIKAVHTFIRSLLANGIQPTHGLVYNSICFLKRSQNPDGFNWKAPSPSWFSKWWKANELHKIRSKPIAIVRVTAQQEHEVRAWFTQFHLDIAQYKIERKNIINFDEAGARIGCAKGEQILVPLDVLEARSSIPFSRPY